MSKQVKGVGEEGDEMIIAVYKVNLHCLQCVREVRKPLMRTQGVQRVDAHIEIGEIRVQGNFDPAEILECIKISSKKEVKLVSPLPKIKEKGKDKKDTKEKDTKELIRRTTTLKVHMHCGKCEYDLRRKFLKLKGVYSVNTDIKAQTVTVDGTIDPQKLIKCIHKKLHKHAEIMTAKPQIKEEKKEKVKEVDFKFVESKRTEDREEKVEMELKIQERNVPYIIHYVYAPQLFSDENPNACAIM